MSLKKIYNNVAHSYRIADRFGALSTSHDCAMRQLEHISHPFDHASKILDLGVGDGLFLQRLQKENPKAEYTGIDISQNMLNIAAHNCPGLNTIEASTVEASRFLTRHSQDLILAHFIGAYIPLDALLTQVDTLAKSNGYLSLITSTHESFPVMKENFSKFVSNKKSLIAYIAQHYYETALKKTTVVSSEQELLNILQEHNFEVIEHQHCRLSLTLNSVNEFIEFGFNAGWLVNGLAVGCIPASVVRKFIVPLVNKIYSFPYHDTHSIAIVLARKTT